MLLNAPAWAYWGWRTMRHVLPSRIVERISLHASAEEFWASGWARERLLRGAVPAALGVGGGMPDEAAAAAGLLPANLTGALVSSAGAGSGATRAAVAARRTEAVARVPVHAAGATVSLRLAVDAHGVGVRLCLVSEDGVEGPVLYDSGPDGVRAGSPLTLRVPVPAPGVVVLTLDNGHSVLRGKSVSYTLDLAPPLPSPPLLPAAPAADPPFSLRDAL